MLSVSGRRDACLVALACNAVPGYGHNDHECTREMNRDVSGS